MLEGPLRAPREGERRRLPPPLVNALLAFARGEVASPLRTLAARDGVLLLSLARRHQIDALCGMRMSHRNSPPDDASSEADALDDFRRSAIQAYHHNGLRNQSLASHACSLSLALRQAGVQHRFAKGLWLRSPRCPPPWRPPDR